MRRGLRYLPVPRRGRRSLGLLGLGIIAAMSLVWQQQATLASYVDREYASATFKAATLSAITPTFTTTAATATGSWSAASGSWATPQYVLHWSASPSGTNPTGVYTGPATSATHDTGSGAQSAYGLTFVDVAAGVTHACGISGGTVYCWGTSSNGALGLGAATTAKIPTAVTGGDLGTKPVSSVTAGADFTCAVAAGKAYCWGLGTNGQLGNGTQSSSTTPKSVSSLTGITSISAGAAHACAVAGGKPYCWGQGASGQLGNGGNSQKESPDAVKVDGALSGRTVASVAAGGSHSCAVADGRAFCWGLNGSGQLGNAGAGTNTPTVVDASGVLMGRTVTQLTAGTSHTCAIADGRAFCWGLGTSGQLGNGSAASSSSPVPVSTSTMTGTVLSLSGGAATTCAAAAGNAYCWGAGTSYGLGNGSTTAANSPVPANGALSGRTVRVVSAGSSFGCAVSSGSPAACWGLGSSYQLGDNDNGSNGTPGDVSLTSMACPDGSVRISATACSLVQGTDYYYRLDYSIGAWDAPASAWTKATTTLRDVVNPGRTASTATSISMNWPHVQELGQARDEYRLERSPDSSGTGAVTLTQTGARSWTDDGGVATTRKFTAVSSGGSHSCAIVGADLYCWGLNSAGQLGVGDTTTRTVPTKVGGPLSGKTVTAVSAGTNHTCAIANDRAYCWGLNSANQLGDGTASTQTSPVAVSTAGVLAGKTVTAVSAGTTHSCVVAGGRAYCWGANGSGQLGDSTGTNRTLPVAVVTGTGDMGTRTVTDIAAGGSHTCAVAEGKAYCWGYNSDGQLGGNSLFGFINFSSTDPVAVTATGQLSGKTVTQVTAGGRHSCVVASSRAYCWGADDYGQLGNNASTADSVNPVAVSSALVGDVAEVSAGSDGTCAIAAGKTSCWGANASGQLGNATTANSAVPVAVVANGALSSATTTSVGAGSSHSCAVADDTVYCWGSGADGRLGTRTTANSLYPVAAVADARCAAGSAARGDGTCSLAPGTTYWYRITYTLDGTTSTKGAWTPLSTS